MSNISLRLPVLTGAATLLLSACSVTIGPRDDGAQSTSDRGTFGKQLQEYAQKHPDEFADLVLNAEETGKQRQADALAEKVSKLLAANPAGVFNDPGDAVLGNPNGDVTIVEWFDNECPFCKRLSPVLQEVMNRDHNVRIVMKEYAILGPISELSARYALATLKQGRYREFHDALMTSTVVEHQLTDQHLLEFAKRVGVDVDRMVADAKDPEIAKHLATTHNLASMLGVNSTPGLIIGTKIYSGPRTADAILATVGHVRENNKSHT